MRIINFDEADPLLTWKDVTNAIKSGHTLPKATVDDSLLRDSDRSLLTRAAWISGLGAAVKSMSVFPGNSVAETEHPSVQGATLLFDDKFGHVRAVIDGILVTKWKTAGDSGLGALLLAPANPKTVLIMGAGTVAHSLFDTYSELFPSIENWFLWNRSDQRAKTLIDEQAKLGRKVQLVTDLPDSAGQADIISCATLATDPILKGEWIKPGTHVDLIGAFRPDMREADDTLLQRAEVFVDSRETTLKHIGELMIPLQSGAISETDVLGDFYDLSSGRAARSSPEAITVFKNGGGAHLDLMVADLIVRMVENSV